VRWTPAPTVATMRGAVGFEMSTMLRPLFIDTMYA
jgi:hypothetical protein